MFTDKINWILQKMHENDDDKYQILTELKQ